MKRRFVHLLQKYLLNPPNKLLFALGIAPSGYALLETIGRKTGKPRRTPVGNGQVAEQFWLIAEHGMHSAYVRNIMQNSRVRLRIRNGFRLTWRTGTAYVLPDDDARERQHWLAARRLGAGRNAAAVRMFGTELLTVRIDLDEIKPK
ncbi:MAG: nitroreductase family deazaflavin-dependent oxidoreductase [Acidobacteria bacterium]|nr:nitroreductase family deazaflavin-dependent oxidoreductase [Acidobacteriota bacterium]